MGESITVESTQEFVFLAMIGGIIFMMLLEMLAPRRKEQKHPIFRWINNVSLTLFTYYATLLGSGLLSIGVAAWVDVKNIGLLQHYNIGTVGAFVAVFVIIEFMTYWLHRAFHVFPILWRIHSVHHSDIEVDVTTSHRNHPLEPLLQLPLTTPLYVLLGAPVAVIIAYQSVRIGMSLFTHSNIYIPERLDRLLRWILVTPDFHRNHHCSDRRFTDSNYGASVPWFDYLFRTATGRPFTEQKSMQLGLEYFRTSRDSRVDQLLWIPFRRGWPSQFDRAETKASNQSGRSH